MSGALAGPDAAWVVALAPPLAGLAGVAALIERLSCRGPYCPPAARSARRAARTVLVGAAGAIVLGAVLGAALALLGR